MIEADFRFAYENLPPTQPDAGRASNWAAASYLAKTYLTSLLPIMCNEYSAADMSNQSDALKVIYLRESWSWRWMVMGSSIS